MTLDQPMQTRRWHQVLISYDSASGRLAVAQRRFGVGSGERHSSWSHRAITVTGRQLGACDWLLAACFRDGELASGFNGRLEAPRLIADELMQTVLRLESQGAASDSP